MKLNDEKLEHLLKETMQEQLDDIKPQESKEDMWGRIEKAKKEKRKLQRQKKYKRIPMYGSSLVALCAILFFLLTIPNASDEATEQTQQKVADVSEKFEAIGEVATFSMERAIQKSAPSIYPTYVPDGYALEKEEWTEDGFILSYQKENKKFMIYKTNTKTNDIHIIENGFMYQQGDVIVEITGDLSKEEMKKVASSMFDE